MKVLIGHTNMDLDCFGSLALGKYLYPDALIVKSRLVHPVAQSLYNLYKNHLNFTSSRDLKDQDVSEFIIFDTRSRARIREYLDFFPQYSGAFTIYDHHINDTSDIPGANLVSASYGSNTTLVALTIKERGGQIDPVDATIGLTGIFADTGNFTHENVVKEDFEASSWLISQGANMKLVSQFLKPLKQEYQISLFHQVVNRLVYKKIHGHSIILSYFEMKEQVSGLAPIVEKVFEVENADAIFILFGLQKARKTLIIARSQKESINVSEILSPFGGGGHTRAASAQLKGQWGEDIYEKFISSLKESLRPAIKAEDLMTADVLSVRDHWTVLEASLFLEKVGHTGAPVLTEKDEVCGFLTLRDISKARRSDQMNAPVKSYMTRKVHSCSKDDGVKDLERFFLKYNVGHIPVTNGSSLLGIITRADYLNHMELR